MHSIIKNDAVNLIYLINKVFMMFSMFLYLTEIYLLNNP